MKRLERSTHTFTTSAAPFSGWWRVNGQRVVEFGWPQWIPWWEAVDVGFPDWAWPRLRRRLFDIPESSVVRREDAAVIPPDRSHRYWR